MDQAKSGTYMDDSGLALQAAAAVESDPRTQTEIAEALDVTPSSISQACNADYSTRIRKLRIRIIEALLKKEVRGPVFHIQDAE